MKVKNDNFYFKVASASLMRVSDLVRSASEAAYEMRIHSGAPKASPETTPVKAFDRINKPMSSALLMEIGRAHV